MIDIKIQRILGDETARQLEDHNFIASENFASEAVMHFVVQTLLTNMQKAIQEGDITMAVKIMTSWKNTALV